MTDDEMKAFEEHKERFRVLGKAVFTADFAKLMRQEYPHLAQEDADKLGHLKFDEMWATDHGEPPDILSRLLLDALTHQKKFTHLMDEFGWKKWYTTLQTAADTANKAYVDFSAIVANAGVGVSVNGGPTKVLFVSALPELPKTTDEAIALMAAYRSTMSNAQKKG